MDPVNIGALAAALATVLAAFFSGIRIIIRELRPNGGNSMRDKINTIESKLIRLEHLIDELLLKR